MYTFTGTSQLAWCKYNTLHDTNGSFYDNMCRFMLKTYSLQCQHTDSCPMKICISGIKHAVSSCESRLLLSPVTYFPRTPSWKVLWSASSGIITWLHHERTANQEMIKMAWSNKYKMVNFWYVSYISILTQSKQEWKLLQFVLGHCCICPRLNIRAWRVWCVSRCRSWGIKFVQHFKG